MMWYKNGVILLYFTSMVIFFLHVDEICWNYLRNYIFFIFCFCENNFLAKLKICSPPPNLFKVHIWVSEVGCVGWLWWCHDPERRRQQCGGGGVVVAFEMSLGGGRWTLHTPTHTNTHKMCYVHLTKRLKRIVDTIWGPQNLRQMFNVGVPLQIYTNTSYHLYLAFSFRNQVDEKNGKMSSFIRKMLQN